MVEPSQDLKHAAWLRDMYVEKLREFMAQATGKGGVIDRILPVDQLERQLECDAQYPNMKCPPRWSISIPTSCYDDWKDFDSFKMSMARMSDVICALSECSILNVNGRGSPSKICDEAEKLLESLKE